MPTTSRLLAGDLVRRRTRFLIVLVLTMLTTPLACDQLVAPRRAVPATAYITLKIIEMPVAVSRGDTAHFTILTDPGNTCGGGIGFWDSKRHWTSIDLAEHQADVNGLCKWDWQVPTDTLAGRAEFWVGVRNAGASAQPGPKPFCIVSCSP
jgi:hypothetical protein